MRRDEIESWSMIEVSIDSDGEELSQERYMIFVRYLYNVSDCNLSDRVWEKVRR